MLRSPECRITRRKGDPRANSSASTMQVPTYRAPAGYIRPSTYTGKLSGSAEVRFIGLAPLAFSIQAFDGFPRYPHLPRIWAIKYLPKKGGTLRQGLRDTGLSLICCCMGSPIVEHHVVMQSVFTPQPQPPLGKTLESTIWRKYHGCTEKASTANAWYGACEERPCPLAPLAWAIEGIQDLQKADPE